MHGIAHEDHPPHEPVEWRDAGARADKWRARECLVDHGSQVSRAAKLSPPR
jgi:hypothetical protein